MAEWSIAPVLKTGNPQGFVSSNLTASAKLSRKLGLFRPFFLFPHSFPHANGDGSNTLTVYVGQKHDARSNLVFHCLLLSPVWGLSNQQGAHPFKILPKPTPPYPHPPVFYLGPPSAGLNHDLLKRCKDFENSAKFGSVIFGNATSACAFGSGVRLPMQLSCVCIRWV